jgi:lipopolysaccharide transport system ATP-binding protein
MSAITVNNISKKFRIPHEKKTTVFQNIIGLVKRQFSYEEFWALDDISFEINEGEAFGIIGRNGSGKSTLLKILAKVLYPDSGSVNINGKVASFLQLGVGFQSELTARENVYIYSSILGLSRKQVDKVYDDIIDFAELKKFENMKLKQFSNGMNVRLAFSTAIHAVPDILLLDEVLAVGDEAFQKKCRDKMDQFKAEGKTVVFVSHALKSVKDLCQRSMLLNGGQIVSIGDTEKVINDYQVMLISTEREASDVSLAIDWDGDGRQELCIFRPGGSWFIDSNHDGVHDPGVDLQLGPYGRHTRDVPLAIDWDGDGRQELCIFSPGGSWRIDLNHNGIFDPGVDLQLGPFGQDAGDTPLAIDWDGDGRQELCIFRADGTWLIDLNHNGIFDPGIDLQLGPFRRQAGDIPLAIDWDGDGKQELCVFRPGGTWFIDLNRDGRFQGDPHQTKLGPFGQNSEDRPVIVRWDRSSKECLCIYRPSDDMWYIDTNRNGRFDPGIDEQLGPFGLYAKDRSTN